MRHSNDARGSGAPGKLDLAASAQASRFERKTRWRYQRDGKDIGPFSPKDLRTQMQKGDVDEDTQVFEEGQQRWVRVGDVPEFANYLFEVARERQRKTEHAEHERAEAAVRAGHKTRSWVSRVAILAALGVVGALSWVALTSASTAPANLARGMLRDPAFGEVRPWTAPTEQTGYRLTIEQEPLPEEKKVEKAAIRKPGRRTVDGEPEPGGALVDTNQGDGAVVSGSTVTTMSFDDEDEGGATRALGSGEVQEVANKVAGKVRGCMAAEAQRRPEFRGATLAFSLEPKGSVGGVRILNGGVVTSALVSCVRKATGSVRVEPFAGGGRRIEIPIAVGTY
ncbi:MAG: hypothetical protein AMXMBFR64_45200 [Myxococcales bacterium]